MWWPSVSLMSLNRSRSNNSSAAPGNESLREAITRVVTADLHPWQTQFLRYCFGGVVILPFLLRGGLHLLRTKNLRLQIGRNLVHTVASGLWFLALPLVPLAEITPISFTGPIFMTIGAMLFFR